MSDTPYAIRTMTRPELDIALDWAAAEGWNPGLYDADCFYAADCRGFFLGLLHDEPIATLSAVKYGAFGFLGFYIVQPPYRGLGFGLEIWQAGLDYLAECTIGLDGVVEQQDNYRKSGFSLAYRNIRHAGFGGGDCPVEAGLVELSALAWPQIEAYDLRHFPAARPAFLHRWFEQPDSYACGMVRNHELRGYGVIRKCRSGYKIGPLFADSPAIAEALFLALKAKLNESEPIFLDVPECNPQAVALAERYGMYSVFETARMYKGAAPQLPLSGVYGVTSFELG